MPTKVNETTFVRITNQDIFNKLTDACSRLEAIERKVDYTNGRVTQNEVRLLRLEKESPVRWARENPAHVFIIGAIIMGVLIKSFGIVVFDWIMRIFFAG
jgi:hypothetical protein